ncbi:unnamed protein product [Adineta steineri]|uniref:Profilin n=1 Tax=Adineta steineri TaxID=433720 RepID=A0A819C1Q7_9BILA|nr:unnamed protein product [Adineta steineri]
MINTNDQDVFEELRALLNHYQRGNAWQPYVDQSLVGTGQVSQAAIIGQDGSVWAISPGFQLKNGEGNKIVNFFKDPSGTSASGMTIAGKKYFTLRADDRSIYGKKALGSGGVILVKTSKTVIIGLYEEGQQPGNAAAVVEGVADYLINNGY